jgi:hypothetical protein
LGAGYNGLGGVDAAGQLFGLIGRYCDMRLDAVECAHDTGRVVDATDLAVDARRRVIAVEPSAATFQLYGASGRLRLTCGSPDFRHFIVSAADPVSGGLLIGYGLTVRRLEWTTKPAGPCRSPRMRLTDVHVRRTGTDGRSWRLSYRLNAPGRVWLDVFREHADPCGTEAVNTFDPHGICTNLWTTYRGGKRPAARGRNTTRLRLPPGRWQIQLRAINESSEGVEAPLIKLTAAGAGR